MGDFPSFTKNPKNRIAASSQHTADIEGYLFDGADGSQVAFWTCSRDRVSDEHSHEFEEYVLVVEGRATLIVGADTTSLTKGDEILIPKGAAHRMECAAGTRTLHVFGGARARRAEPAGG